MFFFHASRFTLHASHFDVNIEIPNKLYFKIGEVAKMMGVEPFVLRYWETEFPEIAPTKSRSKQRLYKREDVEKIAQIKDMLHKQGFTIKGARLRLEELKHPKKIKADAEQNVLSLNSDTANHKKLISTVRQVIREMEEEVKS
jgi:DNA-binding transcriptional MerR regulator